MKKVLFIMLGLLLLSSTAMGCQAKQEEKQVLRFGHFGAVAQRDLYVAEVKGFFAANGVNVELVKLDLTDMVPAIAGGRVDGGSIAPIAALAAISQGVDIKLVASGSRVKRPEQLFYVTVPKDSPIKTVKDLNAKSISGTGRGTCVWSWVKMAEKEHGIAFSQYIEVPGTAQAMPMLFAGRVDSSPLSPISLLIQFKDKVRGILPLTGVAKIGCTSTHLWFSGQFLQKHPDAVRRFINALQQAREYLRENMLESLQISSKYSAYTFEDLKLQLETKSIWEFPSQMQMEVWQVNNGQEVMLDLGLLKAPLDIEKHVDTRFAKPVWEMPKGELDWLPK